MKKNGDSYQFLGGACPRPRPRAAPKLVTVTIFWDGW